MMGAAFAPGENTAKRLNSLRFSIHYCLFRRFSVIRIARFVFVATLLFVFVVGAAIPVVAQEPLPPNTLEDVPAETAPEAVTISAGMAFSGGPLYDSGWVPLEPDESRTLTHNLGGNVDDYVVVMDYKDNDASGINQRYYGGADFGANPPPGADADDRVGAYWRSLTTSTITVYRRPEDTYADYVRIRIWMDAHPDYDSGWVSLSAGAAATTLNHNLSGDPDDYVVVMDYKTGGSSGINQRYYGGADFGAASFGGLREDERVGAYWRTLTSNTITLFRRAEDDYAPEVRVRIWVRPKPTYDSGWVTLSTNQAKTLYHSIGGNPENYVVDMQYRSSGGSGVNQRYYGGADFGADAPSGMNPDDRVGAYWRTLTDSSITVYRRPEDIYAPEVRIRIWHYWEPTLPDYDSGWVSLGAGASATTLTHNLGGSTDDYLVDMTYRSNSSGINRRYFGGADFGATSFGGGYEDERVGAYWRSLTNNTVTVYRRPEDDYAPEVRIRIWVMPKPDYDSGWVSVGAGASATMLTHNLGGDTGDYLVDMQYYSSGSGVNQRYYGGADFGAHPAPGADADDRVGAYWRTLTNSTITVYRRPDDIYAEKVRIRIWRMAQPNYDSDWIGMAQDESTSLEYELSGFPNAYFLTMWQKDTGSNGVNQRYYGGMDLGAKTGSEDARVGSYWRSLDGDSVTVYRRPEDPYADYGRVRIWDYSVKVYLPLLQR